MIRPRQEQVFACPEGPLLSRLRPTLVADRFGGWSWLPAIVYERPKRPVVHGLDAGQLFVA
jgi:hypothetical protein